IGPVLAMRPGARRILPREQELHAAVDRRVDALAQRRLDAAELHPSLGFLVVGARGSSGGKNYEQHDPPTELHEVILLARCGHTPDRCASREAGDRRRPEGGATFGADNEATPIKT